MTNNELLALGIFARNVRAEITRKGGRSINYTTDIMVSQLSRKVSVRFTCVDEAGRSRKGKAHARITTCDKVTVKF